MTIIKLVKIRSIKENKKINFLLISYFQIKNKIEQKTRNKKIDALSPLMTIVTKDNNKMKKKIYIYFFLKEKLELLRVDIVSKYNFLKHFRPQINLLFCQVDEKIR